MIIVICFCATLLGIDFLSDGYVLSDFDTTATVLTYDYYCVQTGIYNTKQTAEYYAFQNQAKGGAGYVFADQEYRVIASVYKKEKEAQTVANRLALSGVDGKIFLLKISPLSDPSQDRESRNKIQEIALYFDYVYQEFYDISNGLDQEIYTYTDVRSRISFVVQKLTDYQNDLDSFDKTVNVSKLSSQIKSTIATITALPISPSSAQLRYAYISVLACAVS